MVGVLDVIAIQASNPIYFTFVSTVLGAATLATTAQLHNVKLVPPELNSQTRQITLTGVLFGGSYLTYVYALSLGNLAHVNTVRSSTLILGGLVGGKYLGESITPRKLLGISLIILSVCGLALS